MTWVSPVPYRLLPTSDGDSFKRMRSLDTGLPLEGHPGSFGFVRKNHTHEGIDIYLPEFTPIYAVEAGKVVFFECFTGDAATPPSPWWHNTWAIGVEGDSGVVIYGEIIPLVSTGDIVKPRDLIGRVKKVLKVDKGRPMSMLHLELHKHGTRQSFEWLDERPESLLDPTPFLLEVAEPSSNECLIS